MSVSVQLYQIAYSPETLAALEPGYQLLDNLDNQRPDWFEYWPIRRHLLTATLDEDAYYGFFSPKFGAKTQMSHAQVTAFVQTHAAQADVLLFSPQPDMGAFFLNVFEQGETFDPGLIEAFDAFLQSVGIRVPLRQMVMDSRQVVFSNYFVAKPAFWREWFALAEKFYAACENEPADEAARTLQTVLTQPTTYKGAPRKVFLMERIASLLLTMQPQWRTRSADSFGFGWSVSRFREHPVDAIISDALKIAFREQGHPEYMQAYAQVRERFRAGAAG